MDCRYLHIQFLVLILIAAAWGQHFNSSTVHSLAQQQIASPQNTRMTESQKQQFQFFTLPTEKKKLDSTEAFENTEQINSVVRENVQQATQSETHKESISLTTPRNVQTAVSPTRTSVHQNIFQPQNEPETGNFHKVSARRQTFQPSTQTHQNLQTSFLPSLQQNFQPLTTFPVQQQIPTQQQSMQPTQQRALHNIKESTVQIKSTSMQQTVQQAKQLHNKEFDSHASTPTPIHQQQTQTSSRVQPSVTQTFPTQHFSLQNHPVTNQQEFEKPTFSQTQHPQQQTVHKILSTQSQQQGSKVVQSQHKMDEPTLSPEEELFLKQARNAKYSFNSAVTDNIMDNTQIRQEKRDGLELSGLYSYSDGFYKRTVHYKADENGYRVTKEEIESIGNGPQINPEGGAAVSTNIAGVKYNYSITAADIKKLREPQNDMEF